MKRIVALILVLLLILASCSNASKKHDNSHNTETSATTEVVNPTTPTPDDNNPGVPSPDDTNPDQNQPEHTHDYKAVVTQPTCNNEGYTTHTCSGCGDSYVSDIVGAPGHSLTSVVTKPTCSAEGYTTYTCSACNFSYISDRVSSLGHDYKVSSSSSPDCDNHGFITYTCSRCNDSYVEDIDASGHGYTTSVTAPTCTSEGYTTYTCTSCGDSYISNKVAAKGHSYTSVVTKPTCTNDGYTTYNCSTCGDSYISNKVTASGHDYKSVVTAPTCTSEGYTTYTCSTCNDSYVSDKVATTEHDYKNTTTSPTCENMGYTTYVCKVCNYSYAADYTDALGHTWKDATTSAPKTCTTCGATEGDKLPSSTPVTAPTLYVSYIDVGQGDSILIKVGDCDILIDAGDTGKGAIVSSYLKSQGVDDIELMINTHPDADHCTGLTQVLTDYVVEEVWISKATKTTKAYTNFIAAVKSEGLTAKKPNAGTVYTYGYLTLTVIYSELVSGDSNNSSIVVMLEYGSFKFLFMGDAGDKVESKLISSGADLDCDVLKVGHHGSDTASTTAFLNKVSAEYGVICVGANNSYGHPTSTALKNLSSAGTTVYRTDKNGNVKFSTDGVKLTLPNGSTDTTGSGSGLPSGGSSSGGSSSGGSSSGGSSSSGSTSGSTSSSDIFIGNTESKVFHLPTCSNLPAASKQNVMYNYWWIINIAGYTPCRRCLGNYSASSTTYIANATSKVYHVSTCSYLPSTSNRVYITSTVGYTPCGHCIK